MRITTDRRTGPHDPFDRLARLVRRLPGAQSLEAALARRQLTQRWLWFLVIYCVSVTVFGAVALFLNAIVPK